MKCKYLRLATTKVGEIKSDDAGYVETRHEGVHLLVISDGATGAIFSGDWAKILSQGFLHDFSLFEKDFLAWRHQCTDRWYAEHKLCDQPWYIENKIEQGSAASLHALIVPLEENTDCRSYCIGDSCFFILRNETLFLEIPKMNPKDFNNSPDLVKTKTEQQIKPRREDFRVCDGDILVLMTDALAKWFIEEYYNFSEERRWAELLQLEKDEEFADFMQKQLQRKREDGSPAIQNDDFTLVKYKFACVRSETFTTDGSNGISNRE